MRAFIAIEINDAVRENLVKAQDKIERAKAAKIKFVEPENLHLTIKFLGEARLQKGQGVCVTHNDWKGKVRQGQGRAHAHFKGARQ